MKTLMRDSGLVIFLRRLLFGRHDGGDPAKVDQNQAAVAALDNAHDELAFVPLHFVIDHVAFRLAQALGDHLLCGHRGHAPERGRDLQLKLQLFANGGVFFYFAGGRQG